MVLVLYERYETGDTTHTPLSTFAVDVFDNAQTFKSDTTHALKRIELKLYKKGTGGNVTIEIRSTTAGLPDGTDAAYGLALASITVDCTGITTNTAGEWIVFDFVFPANLSADITYAICVACDTYDGGNSVHWRTDFTGAYANGQRCDYVQGSATWVGSALDFIFREYGGTYTEGTLSVTGTGSTVLSYEASTATGTVVAIGVGSVILPYEVCIADEGTLVIQGAGLTLLSYEVSDTIEWPFERPEIDPDLTWDEETQTWVSTVAGPGRYRQSVIAIGQGDADEGVIYYGDI